jgi:ABC transport system ATP-binding/permease protein
LPPIISAQELSKRYGVAPLFRDISFTVSEGDRIGLIGPNGSGKSTLLEILFGRVQPDSGTVSVRKRARLGYVSQISEFAHGDSVRSVIDAALEQGAVPEAERMSRMAETLGRAGFVDFDASTSALSGGWRKRLAISAGLAQKPDVLLLDEPTNHLDLAGIEWLETVLQSAPFACVVVSHDRYFLENFATAIVEVSWLYEGGYLRVQGNYSTFLQAKEDYLHAMGQQQASLANRIHTEKEWLRRGPKARATKAKARIEKAHEMIDELAALNMRSRTSAARIDFAATDRKTKQLIELSGVTCTIGAERILFQDSDFIITSGMRVGLVGPNGSGKTTLLRLLSGDLQPARGEIRKADALRVVYFDQNRVLDPEQILRRALAPDSDSVIYQDQVIHVASWAARFLFDAEGLNQRVGRLSGGERARVLIARLMLQPADVLLLDEPTNDLDIPTLEILEESLLEYGGALVLVTHDRYMLDRVSTTVLGFDGLGHVERFADYAQWNAWQRSQQAAAAAKTATPVQREPARPAAVRKKLGYKEARELAGIEDEIAQAERKLHAQRMALEDPDVAGSHLKFRDAYALFEETQKAVDALYARWAELEQKGG